VVLRKSRWGVSVFFFIGVEKQQSQLIEPRRSNLDKDQRKRALVKPVGLLDNSSKQLTRGELELQWWGTGARQL
jgi:hypothetical protein